MKSFIVICPVCGSLNRGVYLEETQGRVECCICKKDFISTKWKSIAGTAINLQFSALGKGGRKVQPNKQEEIG